PLPPCGREADRCQQDCERSREDGSSAWKQPRLCRKRLREEKPGRPWIRRGRNSRRSPCLRVHSGTGFAIPLGKNRVEAAVLAEFERPARGRSRALGV